MNSQYTHADILALPGPERLAWIEQICVFCPRWHKILAKIGHCHQKNKIAAEPQCLLLVGPTGAGKSTLVERYVNGYPPVRGKTIQRPILKATVPSKATEKGLATALLKALGDPYPTSGTTVGMTLRVTTYLKDCGVEMLVLDELQHFVDQDSAKVLLNASNWLKTLIKETRVACVLVGLEGYAEQVVNKNPQLARLFGDAYVLRPFKWHDQYPETITVFRRLLAELDQLLPLAEPSGLDELETAWRLWVASGGVMGQLMKVVRAAAALALNRRLERIDLKLLAEAFRDESGGERRGLKNPFIGGLPERPKVVVNATTRTATGARTGRSQSRKVTRATLSDFK
jgi:TniB protein